MIELDQAQFPPGLPEHRWFQAVLCDLAEAIGLTAFKMAFILHLLVEDDGHAAAVHAVPAEIPPVELPTIVQLTRTMPLAHLVASLVIVWAVWDQTTFGAEAVALPLLPVADVRFELVLVIAPKPVL